MPRDATTRFDDRAEDYVRYRPGYPQALTQHLRELGWLRAKSTVADIGAGTGISSALFLDAGCSVYAVEPNQAMREQARRALAARAGFHAIDGRAEATTLTAASIDLVVAATAFHWFEPVATRIEFQRILRGDGRVALFWNLRDSSHAFMRDYEGVLREHCPGYAQACASRRADETRVREFFDTGFIESIGFENAQSFDFDGLCGRVQSSSYTPQRGDSAHAALLAALRTLFGRAQNDGHVTLRYETRLFVGTLR